MNLSQKAGQIGRPAFKNLYCGGSEIRTHGSLSATLALQASTLNHSVTPPLFWQL